MALEAPRTLVIKHSGGFIKDTQRYVSNVGLLFEVVEVQYPRYCLVAFNTPRRHSAQYFSSRHYPILGKTLHGIDLAPIWMYVEEYPHIELIHNPLAPKLRDVRNSDLEWK